MTRFGTKIARRALVIPLCAAAAALLGACHDVAGPETASSAAPEAGAASPGLPAPVCSTLTAGAVVCPQANRDAAAWSTVSAGGEHTCAIRADGALYCWGGDRYGQLGASTPSALCGPPSGRYACSMSPVPIDPGVTFVAVSAGANHTCAITSAYVALCWGANDAGQLGSASAGNATVVTVPGEAAWTQISAGASHSCGVRTDGVVVCWGANDRGQLGDGTILPDLSLVAVPLPERATSVSAGQQRTCARTVTGAIYCWGAMWLSRSGGLEMSNSQPTPALVQVSSSMRSVSVGAFTTCALDNSSAAFCWEANPRGELGNGTLSGTTTPSPVTGGQSFAQISSGLVQSCGVGELGVGYCWGDGTFGQLGVSPALLTERCDSQGLPCSTVPLPVSNSVRFTQISTGFGSHVCGVTVESAIYCWGLGSSGQLGNGASAAVQAVPSLVVSRAGDL